MAVKTNLVVDQGANFIYNVYLIDEDGNTFDISGYTANAQIRKSYTSKNPAAQFEATLDSSNGKMPKPKLSLPVSGILLKLET